MGYIKEYCAFVQVHKFEHVQMCKTTICIFTFD